MLIKSVANLEQSSTKINLHQWGAHPHTLRTSALALTYSCAEYAAAVWERSANAKHLDPLLNETCRIITGCLKPTPVNQLYLLSGIAPPKVRRSTASMVERSKQLNDPRHPMFGQEPARSRLKSRHSFLTSVHPLTETKTATRRKMWDEILKPEDKAMGILPDEKLPPGNDQKWPIWKSLNRLRSQVGKCAVNMFNWGYQVEPTLCHCGQEQTMAHLLTCANLEEVCTREDLAKATPAAINCAIFWMNTI